jgi:transposase
VKRQKNDAIDAEAICEAAQRPSMRFVAVKSEQQQAAGLVFRTRDGSSAYRKNHSQIAPTEQQESRGKSAVALYPLADGVGIGFQYHL